MAEREIMGTKILKQALAAMMLISACFSSLAQDVDGISLWDQYTKKQLIQRYGQPVSYESQEGDSPEDGLIEVIKFKDVFFYLSNNQVLDYSLESNKSRALTKTIEGGIRIGDNVGVLNPINNCLARTRTRKDGTVEYRYYLEKDCDDSFYVGVKDGVIVDISAVARVF